MAFSTNLHLILEAHVVLDIRHADVVGNLLDLIPQLAAGKDSRAAQAVNCRMLGVIRLNIPFVFLDLQTNPFLPASANLEASVACRRPPCFSPPCEWLMSETIDGSPRLSYVPAFAL